MRKMFLYKYLKTSRGKSFSNGSPDASRLLARRSYTSKRIKFVA